MFEAIVHTQYNRGATLGPTDTRDEAARLARAWMEAYGKTERPDRVTAVHIRAVEDE